MHTEEGGILNEHNQIREHIETTFRQRPTIEDLELLDTLQQMFTEKDNIRMEAIPITQEIEAVVFGMKATSSPRWMVLMRPFFICVGRL